MTRAAFELEDLPEHLLYSREKCWVELKPGGRARIGFATPAWSTARVHLYYLDLLPRGYLVAGRPFGGLDLDRGRIGLLAPVSGRIVATNPRLEQEPELLISDPFGEGWLVELERVAPDAARALMDRERFWAFLRFERNARRAGIRPVLAAESRWERGSPWPAETWLAYGERRNVFSQLLRRGRNPDFTPQWQPGQWWIVEYRRVQPSLARVPPELAPDETVTSRWRYEVIDLDASVGGRSCVVVRAEEIGTPPPPSFALLYYDVDNFCLRLIEERNRYLPDRRSLTPNTFGDIAPYLETRQPRETIVDLALFPPEQRTDLLRIDVAGEPELLQTVVFPTPDTLEASLEAQVRGVALSSEQRWRRGAPWWSTARRTLGGREMIAGELVESGP